MFATLCSLICCALCPLACEGGGGGEGVNEEGGGEKDNGNEQGELSLEDIDNEEIEQVGILCI